MCGTAKEMTMYKEEDEHVIAVVPLMENNVLFNENTSLPATENDNSSSTSNIRIEEEEIVEALEKDARRRGISIRSLVNDVLSNYVTSDKYSEEAGKEPQMQHKIDVEEEQKRATVNSTRILS
jgi:hypothetical protein